jgi:hypothetical protein
MSIFTAGLASLFFYLGVCAEACPKNADKDSWYHFSDAICFLSKDDPEFGWLSNYYIGDQTDYRRR